jgi:valyl-tRNA synthetase
MVCTFGDTTDITWWKGLNLPLRTIIDRSGRLQPIKWGEGNFECMDTQASQEAYNALVGLTINQARKVIVELLSKTQSLLGEPRPIKHMVKFYEKGEHPLEIVTSRQWFIKILDLKEDLLKRGEELCWWPPSMATRYRTWVEGLNSDWNISRQRFFGVPIPLWYRLDENGNTDHSNVIIPEEDELPIDPSSQAPKGFTEEQRGKPNGFIGELDVLDTWATSSLTPQIAGKWSGASGDEDLFSKVFPIDLRPQGQDIIRTWLFSTVVRSHL